MSDYTGGVHIGRVGTHGSISTMFTRSPRSSVLHLFLTILVTLSILTTSLFIVKAGHASPPCPCHLFTASQPSVVPAMSAQGAGIELGFKFKADQNGYISGIRFYKVAGMAGTHTASLWNMSGIRIAQAIFTSESPTGWQEVDFSPVAVTANSIYTASVFMADGNYDATSNFFTSDITNSPLLAPQQGMAHDDLGNSGQGVFDASGSSIYPRYSFNATNYWVDVSYVTSPSTSPIGVSAKTPAAGSTNVLLTDAITATFDRAVDGSTVSSASFVVKDAQNNIVPGVVSYDPLTYTVKFIPNSIWHTGTTYTVTINGNGTNPAIADLQGYKLAADYAWSFTTTTAALACPCTLRSGQNPAGSESYRDTSSSGLELGMKVVPTANGYLTALRFYKPIIDPGVTHIGHVWDTNGTSLATVTFTNESAYGWQEALLSSPLPVVKDQVYIISYGLPTPNFQAQQNAFTQPMLSAGLAAYPAGDARNEATGSGTGNPVYTTTAGVYPSSASLNNIDYYVDAVFSPAYVNVAPSPKVVSTQPLDKSYGVLHTAIGSATFDRPLDSSTVGSTTVTAYDENNNRIVGMVSYESDKWTIVFTPTSPLAYNTSYTIKLSSAIKDIQGASLGTNYSWSFTTGSPLASNINQGNGGPILVVTTSASQYGNYYAEILRTEGLTYFDVKDISAISASVLKNYKAVVLSEMTVTQPQADILSSWVYGGGNLIAMRPDKKLAGLLGLTDAGSSSTNQYLRTNTASTAGMGIVDDTIQFKGVADNYIRSGAQAVATLYSDGSTATPYPAVTTRSVGAGTADAFTYDLARSVIGLHQGNIAWSGQDRDGDGFIRTNDLFYGQKAGDLQPDWLDSSKMAIPQADEQQRLFANVITEVMKKTLPAPRFWYLPDGQKAALVLAGDDHDLTDRQGTEQIDNNWLNESTIGCSVMDWQCVRSSNYVFVGSELTDARASQYTSYGFGVADHPSDNGNCTNSVTDYATLNSTFANDLAAWRAKYVDLPIQRTSRYHCYTWNSWDMMPRADVANGIRYDLNTVAFPAAWVGIRSPLVTGSGMNMRLTDASGALMDVRQGVTNFDNTSAGATSIAATLDNALGTPGYYGIFGSHFDMTDTYQDTLYTLAKSRNVSLISSVQALSWLDGRDSSNFTNLTSSQPGKVTFTIVDGEGAHGLQAMMPMNDAGGTLSSITLGAQPVTYTSSIIKGVQYALFSAFPGDYTVMYSDFRVLPPTASVLSEGATPANGVAADTEQDQPAPGSAKDIPSVNVKQMVDQPSKVNGDRGIVWAALVVGVGIVIIGGVGTLWFFGIRPRLR